MSEHNTAEQKAAHAAQEAAWDAEKTWPIWEVTLEGDDALYVARPGSHVAEVDTPTTLYVNDEIVYDDVVKAGSPAPWVDKARCTVTMHAQTEDQAKMIALRAETAFHTVKSVRKLDV